MAKDSDTSVNSKSLSLDDSTSNKSFVTKVKSRVSGFLPSSLTRWFGSTESQVRYRDESDEEDDESYAIHPPAKRIKQFNNSTLNFQSNTASTPKLSVNHVETKLTFPEPIPGPSGFKAKKNSAPSGKSSLNKQLYTVHSDVMNGDKYSDSGESVTSGYSSTLVGGKDVVTENKGETTIDSVNEESIFTFNRNSRLRKDRSLFEDRGSSPQQPNTSLSTRQPSFNSSVFGSPNFVDRTLASKKILNSPFYSGRTAYGGASAYGRTLASLSDNRSTLRNTVQIKPVNETKNNTTLSKTARRILDTLEQYTTPITDAKKIPNPTNPNNRKKHTTPYVVRERASRALQVPTVPDLLKMKLKERLQESTVSVRQLANSSKSVLNREEYKIRTIEEDNNSTKHTNKMKNKISSVRQKNEPHRTVEEVKLPDIQLPITTLPKFDFSLPPFEPIKASNTAKKMTEIIKTVTSVEKVVTDTQKTVERSKTEIKTLETCKKDNNINKTCTNRTTESKKSEHSKVTEFKFSDPVVIAENLKSIRAINNFIFSEPTPTNKTAEQQSKKINLIVKNNGECSKKDFKDDLLAKFKPPRDTWECSVCLIRNLSDKNKCVACEAQRPQDTAKKEPPPSTGFGDKFKIAQGQWSCATCLIVNQADKSKCVACESPKPSQDKGNDKSGVAGLLTAGMWECTVCLVRNKDLDAKCVACTAPKPVANGPLKPPAQGFGDKFAPPPNTWLCDTCSIRNKDDIPKCVACQSSRPATAVKAPSVGFGDGFKKKADQWECDTCMVRNPSDRTKCQCCDALRPGAVASKEKSNVSLFNFGIDPNAKLTTSGFSFGIKPEDNKKDVIAATSGGFIPMFGQNVTTTTNSVTTTSAASGPTFTFGIKPAQEKSDLAVNKPINKKGETVQQKPLEEAAKISFGAVDSKNQQKKDENNSTLNGENKSPAIFGTQKTTESSGNPPANIFSKDTNLFAFNAAPTTATATTTPTPTPSIFGANPAQNTTATFKFSTETNDKPALFTSAKPITFSSNPTPQTTPIPSLGNPNPQTTPLPSLGNPTPQATPPTFGTPNLFNDPSNKPAFGASSASVVDGAFGAKDSSSRVDEHQQQPPAKVPAFSFGQAAKKADSTEQPKFAFGAVQAASAATGGFNFGTPAAQPSLNFSAGSNAAPSAGGSAANQNGAGIFKFGTGASGGSAAKPGFSFGTPSVAPPAANQAGGASSDPASGMFNFGFTGATPAPSTGFNFSSGASTDFKPNFLAVAAQPPTFSSAQHDDKPTRVTRKAVRRIPR